MPHYLGVLFAFIALISWGFGDFFIQKTARAVGSLKALFFIGIVGLVSIFPFIKSDLSTLTTNQLLLLSLLAVIVFFAAFFDFEALRRGKIAIVEPVIGLELPLTVALSVTLGQESLGALQIILIALAFIGIVLTITTQSTNLHYHKRMLEKGVMLAGIGAIGMALTNFLIGTSSQSISPLVTIWFAHSFLAIICGAILFMNGSWRSIPADIKNHTAPIVGQSILDNVAWISFAFATTIIPISIATTISESYVVLAVLLGIFINKERLKKHQIIGIIFAAIGVMAISYFS